MIINVNGSLKDDSESTFSFENRGYKFGDALFETFKVFENKILFFEDHYFRLMSSMRILRMDIPKSFSMKFLENEISKVIHSNNLNNSTSRIRLSVDRGDYGTYFPESNTSIQYVIQVQKLDVSLYKINQNQYIIDLFKDYLVPPSLLSTLKTTNKILQVIGSIYASENGFENCLVLNTNKHIIEALNGNVFVVNNNFIKTPPLKDGCLRGIMRKQIIDILKKDSFYNFQEASISPFELQKADEIFITNTIRGVISVSQYRKKSFSNTTAKNLINQLNIKAGLSY